MKLASQVATGTLRGKGGAIVDCLFKSVMLKLTRDCKERPNSSKHMSSETMADLAFVLGRGKCLSAVLKLFGVTDWQPKINFQHSTMPQFYATQIYNDMYIYIYTFYIQSYETTK